MQDDEKVTYFAETDSRNKQIRFGIKAKDRTRHMYVIGKTGMGKSTVLENMAIQDIQNGNGLAFIDPHGKTADLLLEYVPESRMKDVLYFAPFDLEFPVSFNVMEDVGPDKRHLVVNGLMSAFKKIWVDAWSARMEYILSNTLLALLEYPGSTLLGINKMLADKDFRKKVVENVTDPSVKAFWVDEFGKWTERFVADAIPAIQNKVGQFTSSALIRNIIGQPESTFDIRKMMDEKKILIINLSKGRVGEGNANLLGSMLITKIYLAAMSRADQGEGALKVLPNFYLYVDEFQSFANESFADILSEARKYKLNLTIAHQYIEQMEEEVRSAVFGNVGTMITFRVGAYDAEVLEKEFAPQFTAEDLVNLGQYQMYLKLMIEGVGSSPFSAKGMSPIPRPATTYVKETIDMSRAQFAKPRAEVELGVSDFHEILRTPPPAPGAKNPNSKPAPSISAAPSSNSAAKPVSKPIAPTPASSPARASVPTSAPAATVQKVTATQKVETTRTETTKVETVVVKAATPVVSTTPAPKPVATPAPAPMPKVETANPFKEAFAKAQIEKPVAHHVPLQELAKPHPIASHAAKKKSPSPESISSLRDALKAVLPSEPAKSADPVEKKTDKPAEKSAEKSPEKAYEIPEPALRKMLDVS